MTDNSTVWKMHGLGNQILVVDGRPVDDARQSAGAGTGGDAGSATSAASVRQLAGDTTASALPARLVERLAKREATAFDQLMYLTLPREPGSAATVTIYNMDGSTAGACGNGMRCVALYEALRTKQVSNRFDGPDGTIETVVQSQAQIAVDMGRPKFTWDDIPLAEPFHDTRGIELQIGPIDAPVLHSPSVVNVGNPHAVFWVDDVDAFDLERFGPMLENHPTFPDRANISLAQVMSPEAIRVRTWERGAGLTQACGSAACAVTACAIRKKFTGQAVRITLPGGELHVEQQQDGRLVMVGPAQLEATGTLAEALGS
ncbi:MAG: diaminopimelate epimerase [Pseudomonadota bacterium]